MGKNLKFLIASIILMVAVAGGRLYYAETGVVCAEQLEIVSETDNSFTAEELREDLDFMIRNMEEIHPNLYHSIEKSEFMDEAQKIKSSFKDGMSDEDFVSSVKPLISKLKDGHTWIMCAPSTEDKLFDGKHKVFPYKVKYLDGRLFIVGAPDGCDKSVLNKEIVSIDSNRVEDMVGRYLSRTSGELDHCRVVGIESGFPFSYALSYGFADEYELEYKEPYLDKIEKKSFKGICYQNTLDYAGETVKPYTYEYMENIKSGYIEFNSFRNMGAFRDFLESSFDNMDEKGAKNLIIDLRKNGGGDATLGKLFTCYLTDKEFRGEGSNKMKVSHQLIEYWADFMPSIGYPVKLNEERTEIEIDWGCGQKSVYREGDLEENTMSEGRPFDVEKRFDGQVYVLIGSRSFSSAVMFSSILKDYEIATFIGSETGGVAGGYTDNTGFRLPNLNIRCNTSHAYFTRPSGEECKHGVLPDYEVEQDVDDYFEGKDTALEYTRELILKRQN